MLFDRPCDPYGLVSFLEGFETNFHSNFREICGDLQGFGGNLEDNWGESGGKLKGKALEDGILH